MKQPAPQSAYFDDLAGFGTSFAKIDRVNRLFVFLNLGLQGFLQYHTHGREQADDLHPQLMFNTDIIVEKAIGGMIEQIIHCEI